MGDLLAAMEREPIATRAVEMFFVMAARVT
jgi:hypothetical protein